MPCVTRLVAFKLIVHSYVSAFRQAIDHCMYVEAFSPIAVLCGPLSEARVGDRGQERYGTVQKRCHAENGTNARLCTTELLYHIFI